MKMKELGSMSRNKTGTVSKWTDRAIKEFARNRDPVTRDDLILGHQKLVHYLASKFANRGIPLEDLVQVGMIGLINAVDRFDPNRGARFSTYATPTILGWIRRHFRDTGWSLKVPRRLQELNVAASKTAREISAKIGRSPSVGEIAQRIGTSEEMTLEAIEIGKAYSTISLDSETQNDRESTPVSMYEFLGQEDASLCRIEAYGDLTGAMNALESHQRVIIYYRFFKELSQNQIAKKLNISQMHVSRLQKKALLKLKELLADSQSDMLA